MSRRRVALADDVRAHAGVVRDAKTEGGLRTEEERNFVTAMHHSAIGAQIADEDQDGRLTFEEFAQLIREREEGEHADDELRQRFAQMDVDSGGTISLSEYMGFCMRDALLRSSERVIDLFRKWNGGSRSGVINKAAFQRVIRTLGFDTSGLTAVELFDAIDVNRNDGITYDELNAYLRKGAGSTEDESRRHSLRRTPKEDEQAALAAKRHGGIKRLKPPDEPDDSESQVLKKMGAGLDPSGGQSGSTHERNMHLMALLCQTMEAESLRILDLFREIDVNSDGRVSEAEFLGAMATLGLLPRAEPPKKGVELTVNTHLEEATAAMRALFRLLDPDGSGSLEYGELASHLQRACARLPKSLSKDELAKLAAQERAARAKQLRRSSKGVSIINRNGVGSKGGGSNLLALAAAQGDLTGETIQASLRRHLARQWARVRICLS